MEHDSYERMKAFFYVSLYLEMYVYSMLHQSLSTTTSMGRADVLDLILHDATEQKKILLLFFSHLFLSLCHFCLSLPLVCIKVQPIARLSFHEPRFRRFGF